MKTLYVTDSIPKDALILLVDMENKYFDEVIYYEEEDVQEILNSRVYYRLKRMKETLLSLKEKGHTVAAVVSNDIHPTLQGIPDVFLPSWDYGRQHVAEDDDLAASHILHPAILAKAQEYSSVIVCGLWKELCVYIVARKLQEAFGNQSLLYTDSSLTLENGMLWMDNDNLTLEQSCEMDNVKIVHM